MGQGVQEAGLGAGGNCALAGLYPKFPLPAYTSPPLCATCRVGPVWAWGREPRRAAWGLGAASAQLPAPTHPVRSFPETSFTIPPIPTAESRELPGPVSSAIWFFPLHKASRLRSPAGCGLVTAPLHTQLSGPDACTSGPRGFGEGAVPLSLSADHVPGTLLGPGHSSHPTSALLLLRWL